ncbi:hypothetical protein ACWD4J_39750 [Streptomyces sp. NPDC002577]
MIGAARFGVLDKALLAQHYDPPNPPDDNTLLRGLRHEHGTEQAEDLTYADFLDRMASGEQQLRAAGDWFHPHPWLNLILPEETTGPFVRRVLDGLTEDSLGRSGLVLVYPIPTEKLRTPFVRRPAGSTAPGAGPHPHRPGHAPYPRRRAGAVLRRPQRRPCLVPARRGGGHRRARRAPLAGAAVAAPDGWGCPCSCPPNSVEATPTHRRVRGRCRPQGASHPRCGTSSTHRRRRIRSEWAPGRPEFQEREQESFYGDGAPISARLRDHAHGTGGRPPPPTGPAARPRTGFMAPRAGRLAGDPA